MARFEITFLGCGGGVPTPRHMTTAQLVNVDNRLYLVDCGEGTQTQLYKYGLRLTNLDAVFISHMHGDHFFGLLPLLSSLGLLLGRTADLHVYMPQEMVEPFRFDLRKYCHLPYQVVLHGVDTTVKAEIYSCESLTVHSVPLQHRVPCMGFLFREKQKDNVLLPDRCKDYGIPYKDFAAIKSGADYTAPDGTAVPNSELTRPSDYVLKSYAYCSDTAYSPSVADHVRGVDLLYHEATFLEKDARLAAATAHSTATQAADIARLAGVGRMAIGHYSLSYDSEDQLLQEATAVFPDTLAAQEGLTLTL